MEKIYYQIQYCNVYHAIAVCYNFAYFAHAMFSLERHSNGPFNSTFAVVSLKVKAICSNN